MAPTQAGDADRLQRLSALLDEVLVLEPEARIAWLAALPGEDAELAPALTRMLARGDRETAEFLSHPVALPEVLSGIGDDDEPGSEIGPYRLIAELGQGGMGKVWLAERSDGSIKRRIALKLPASVWVPGLAQRMRREGDILASLEHPNIARLYDAGVTDEGRPYLALEYVEGEPIDVFCQEHALDVPARLGLFLQVAQAVSHAHGRLVVHRDLKPNNILVTENGDVRLLDFGIAKLLSDDPASVNAPNSQLTRYTGRVLTLDYASPEQILAERVTIASDVYSLGVVLFELLTGQRPYRLKRNSAGAIEDAITEQEPPAASSVAQPRTARKLKGDLDVILAKALKKNIADRYRSVESFAADITRYLAGEPVLAQPDSLWYRTRKFARRHAGAVVSAAAIFLAVAAGSGVALWQARVARVEANRAEEVKRFIASLFNSAETRSGAGGEVLATDLLAAAGTRIEKELAGNPRAAAELGVIVAESLDHLGKSQQGEQILRAAVPRAEREFGQRHAITVRAKVLLANLVRWQDPKAAEAIVDEVLPHAKALLPETAEITVFAIQLKSFVAAKREAEAESYAALKESIALAERYLGPGHGYTVFNMGLLSNTYGRFGKRDEQLKAAKEAMSRAEQYNGALRPNLMLTTIERFYAEALRANDRPGEAIPILRRVVDDQRRLDVVETTRVRHAIRQLALALEASGQVAEAIPLMRKVVALEQEHNKSESEDRVTLGDHLTGMLLAARQAEATQAEAERVAAIRARLGQEPLRTELPRTIRRAQLLALLGDHPEAEGLALDAARRAEQEHAPFHVDALRVAAFNARMQRRHSAAERYLREAEKTAKSNSSLAQSIPLASLFDLSGEMGATLFDLGRFDEAGSAFSRCRQQYEAAQVALSTRVSTCVIGLARLQLQNGQAADAREMLLVLTGDWAATNPGSVWHGEALYWLARAQQQSGHSREARATQTQARSMLEKSRLPALRRLLRDNVPA